MGYFLLFERMLPTVLNVRDRCLAPGGLMMPGRVRIYLAATNHKLEKEGQDSFDLGLAYPLQPLVIDVDPNTVVSDKACLLDLDLYVAETKTDAFIANFSLEIT
jgi:hypothetical protein